MAPEELFLAQLPHIDRVIAILARRHALSKADAEEFGAWAKARLIDRDYAVLRKFAGRSSVATFLSVVLGNLFLDHRNQLWGRWRPSAAATRIGPIGIRLEELLYRDGSPLREVLEILRSGGTTLSDIELRRLAAQLPDRQPQGEVSLESLDGSVPDFAAPVVSTPHGDDFAALRAAIEALQPEDRVIIRMRFWHDASVADIARALRVEQKPLYRRIETIEGRLRAGLEQRGIDRERAQDMLAQEVAW